jgi:hypothetical protein
VITPEQYAEIYERVQAGGDVTSDEAKLLVDSIISLDQQAVIFQNAIVLCVENARLVVESLAQGIINRSGRTDKKMRNDSAKMAANALANFENALNMYLTGAFAEAGMLDTNTDSEPVGQQTSPIETNDNEGTAQ